MDLKSRFLAKVYILSLIDFTIVYRLKHEKSRDFRFYIEAYSFTKTQGIYHQPRIAA
jgi:hypothetical protein